MSSTKFSRTAADHLLNEGQLARLWNISIRTLQKWRTTGDGPRFVKVGSLVRYRPSDIDDFVARNTVEHTSEGYRNR